MTSALYGLRFEEPNLLILMQHRAVLLGAFFIVAVSQRQLQPQAFVGGLIAAGSYVVLARLIEHNASLERVAIAATVAVACLVVAAGLWAVKRLNG